LGLLLLLVLLLVVVRLLLGCRVWLRSQAAAAVRGPTAAGLQPLLQQQVQRVVAPGCRQQVRLGSLSGQSGSASLAQVSWTANYNPPLQGVTTGRCSVH